MTDISFYCGHCGQHLDAPPEMAGEQLACPACNKPIRVPGTETNVSEQTPTARGPLVWRVMAGIVGGLIIATLAVNIFNLLFADPAAEEPGPVVTALSGVLFFGLWIGAIILGIRSLRAARAWRHLLIPSGILSLVLPLAALVTTGRMASAAAAKGGEMAELEAGAYAAGGTIFAIVIGFFGLILGAIFLAVGLLVGKNPKT